MKRLLVGVTVAALCVSTSFAGLFTHKSNKFVAVTLQDSRGHQHKAMLLQEDATALNGKTVKLMSVPAAKTAAAMPMAR